MSPFEIPGYTFAGYVRAENVNGGKPIPLFNPASPPPGRLSLNTLEGWNTAAKKQNQRFFRSVFGHDPVDDAELREWILSQV